MKRENDGETDHPFETTATGLTDSEVESLRKQYGYHELSETKQNPFLKFLSYFWGSLPWMIEIAAILSAFVKHWEDLVVMTILLVVNAIVGFWEEYKAGNTIAVAMPTVLSVTMAVGAQLLARKQAVVSRLAAIEELAGMDVLCSDKTGTFTQNRLALGEPYLSDGKGRDDLILEAALASRKDIIMKEMDLRRSSSLLQIQAS